MKIEFTCQVPKDMANPEFNEDIYRIDIDRSLIVLCDGASESFDSKTWAVNLADKFLIEQDINHAWINDAISRYNELFDYSKLSWSKQAAFERGSFSTLLGITYSEPDNVIEMTGIGDTVAILINNNEIIDSFPYTSAEEFLNHPELLSTNLEQNSFLYSSNQLVQYKKAWNIERNKNLHILLMTDALAEWLFRNWLIDRSILTKLIDINDEMEFEKLVLAERSAKNMKTDDSTLIKLWFKDE